MRKIIHIDMDAFYASIEQRDNPAFRGKPVAVGHSGKRGVVAAASYEARRYGVRSAMASVTALRKCPQLIFVQPRFDVYKSVSRTIMDIFREYTDKVEPLSLDEAFLDVTENHKNMPSATLIAQEIKLRIKEKTNLTASAGVSFNKFLAKIASDYRKPDGLFVVRPQDAEKFIEQLAIDRFFGVGKVTAKRMAELDIKNGFDLKQKSLAELTRHFGKAGEMYYLFARGEDNREVETDHVRKSLGAEETFEDDLFETADLLAALKPIADEVARRAKKRDFSAKTVTLKAKYADFSLASRSKTLNRYIQSAEDLFEIGRELLLPLEDEIAAKKIRLLGLTLKNNETKPYPQVGQAMQLWIAFEKWDDET
ncbi:MAG: DNA polymerase IV [Dysgonamonadaceae bacterium]|nr:DNA polymerase IV [Dysgonamonadaceae bacterium]